MLRRLCAQTFITFALSSLVGCHTFKSAIDAIPIPHIPLPKLPKMSSVKKMIPGLNGDDSVDGDDPRVPFDPRGTLGYGHTLRIEVYEGTREVRQRFKDIAMVDKQGVLQVGKIGSARLGGRTLPEARRMIEGVFRTGGFAAAQVNVHIVSVENTQIVSVEGDVAVPSSLPLWDGITISEAIRYSGGRRVGSRAEALYVIHEGKRRFFPNVKAADAEIELRAGDIITVSPDL
jgi:protein involved in polysaccharide export with SLBB domain